MHLLTVDNSPIRAVWCGSVAPDVLFFNVKNGGCLLLTSRVLDSHVTTHHIGRDVDDVNWGDMHCNAYCRNLLHVVEGTHHY